jgi:hypothetical protein
MPRPSHQSSTRIEQLTVVHPHAAGLDIGAHEIVAAVPPPSCAYRSGTGSWSAMAPSTASSGN